MSKTRAMLEQAILNCRTAWIPGLSLERAEAIRDALAAEGRPVVCEILRMDSSRGANRPHTPPPEERAWAVRILPRPVAR